MSAAPTFETELVAKAEHIDELGHVNNAVWVEWIQDVAVAHWRFAAAPEHDSAYFWVVVRHEIDYLRPAFEGDRVTARTWIDAQVQGARSTRHMEFVGPDGKAAGPRANAVGDHRQGRWPSRPGPARGSGAVPAQRLERGA